jgi:tRNA wybutosine-synthesizing protein 3
MKEDSRFKMTKEHHAKTFKTAQDNGKMDKDFVPICEYISKTKDYFTTSSCAGRIVLVGLDEKERKKESAFHRKWHRKVTVKEVLEGINSYDGAILWFKQEPIIFHLGAKTLEGGKKILTVCEKAGIKRAGIKVAKEGKYIVEMVGTHNINTPVKSNGEVKVSEEYISYLVEKANEKFDKNKITLKKLATEIKKNLK